MSIEELKAAAAELGYVVVRPYEKVIVEGEGSDDEYELVPTSRQLVYETAINELKARLDRRE